MFNKSIWKKLKDQSGQAMTMALILLVVAIFIVVPGLLATGNMLTLNQDLEKDTMAYYAAKAGVAYAQWNFKQWIVPSGTNAWVAFPNHTTPSANWSYQLTNQVNGMDVKLTLLKLTDPSTSDSVSTDYFIQSSALSGSTSKASIIFEIRQGNYIFTQAVATLNGPIVFLNSTNKITSDNIIPGNLGNIYATGGDYTLNGADVQGTENSTVRGNYPLSYYPPISYFTVPADAGTNYTAAAADWDTNGHSTTIQNGYVIGPVEMGGNNTFTLQGNLHVITSGKKKGTLITSGTAVVQGLGTIICDDVIDIKGTPTTLLAGNIPFIIYTGTATDGIRIRSAKSIAAILYAPNTNVRIDGGMTLPSYNLYGASISKTVDINQASTVVKYLTEIEKETQIPGTKVTTLLKYSFQ